MSWVEVAQADFIIELVEEEHLFNTINAHVMGSIDPGLLVIQGKVATGVDPKEEKLLYGNDRWI